MVASMEPVRAVQVGGQTARMNILKVSNSYHPFVEMGGPPVKVRAIAERLVQMGHQVTVLTANRGRPSGTMDREVDGVRVVYLRTIFRHRAVTLNPGVVSFCIREIRRFDVVHIYGLYDLLGPIVAMLCRRWGVPYVVEPLGMHRPVLRSLRVKRLFHLGLGKTLVGRAARVIATSDQERDQLIDDGLSADRLVLRRNGIDLAEFDDLPPRGGFRRSWGIEPRGKVVLFLGRLVPIKRLDLLIDAFAGLPLEESRLVITGADEGDGYVKRLEAMVAQRDMHDRVVFTGPLYGQDKLEALVDADVLVLPSQSESFGNVAAEAMACGTPVVVTEGCGISTYVEGRAGLVVSHDTTALREALRRLLTDADLRRQFRAQAPVVAGELSWDEPVAQMDAIYRQVTDAQKSRVAASLS